MAVFVTKCPHCNIDMMAFPIFGVRPSSSSKWKTHYTPVAGCCGSCDGPVVAFLAYLKVPESSEATYQARIAELTKPTSQLENLGFELRKHWPVPQEPEAPADLPKTVERAFMQAEKNRMMPDCEEAAATMYRRALDLALKEAFPDEKGSLDGKLKKLVLQQKLPASLGEWAHEVRLIGNDGAHDIDGVSKDDLLDARAFIDTVLKYIFTLPAQIASRRPVDLA